MQFSICCQQCRLHAKYCQRPIDEVRPLHTLIKPESNLAMTSDLASSGHGVKSTLHGFGLPKYLKAVPAASYRLARDTNHDLNVVTRGGFEVSMVEKYLPHMIYK